MKNPMNDLDRIGLNRSSVSVLGKDVMAVQIPISAGRDAARLIELATVDYHLRTLGYSMAQQFQDRVRDRINWNTMQEGKRDPLAPDM
jgi:HPr kinase/phosphorylase